MLTRQQWSYDKQPDYRAEAYLEWVIDGEGAEALKLYQAEQIPTDLSYARAERARADELEDLEDEYDDAVPF